MPLFADLIAAFAAGLLALLAARWCARSTAMPERPTDEVARAAGEEFERIRGCDASSAGGSTAPSRRAYF